MINCVIIMHDNISTNHSVNNKDAILSHSLAEGLQSAEEEKAVFSFLTLIKCSKIEVLGSDLDRQTCRANWQSFSSPKRPHCFILALIIERYKWT